MCRGVVLQRVRVLFPHTTTVPSAVYPCRGHRPIRGKTEENERRFRVRSKQDGKIARRISDVRDNVSKTHAARELRTPRMKHSNPFTPGIFPRDIHGLLDLPFLRGIAWVFGNGRERRKSIPTDVYTREILLFGSRPRGEEMRQRVERRALVVSSLFSLLTVNGRDRDAQSRGPASFDPLKLR